MIEGRECQNRAIERHIRYGENVLLLPKQRLEYSYVPIFWKFCVKYEGGLPTEQSMLE